MFNFFKKRLEAKEVFFTLNKHLFSSIYELREITLNDSRRVSNVNGSVVTIYAESAALVFFLIASPVQISGLPSSIKTFLLSTLKGCAMLYVTKLEKNESQKFLESRYDNYYSILERVGYNNEDMEAEICSKFLDFAGIGNHKNDIIQKLSYTSFIGSLFLFSMEIIGTANKDFKIIYNPLSKQDWGLISAQSQQAGSEHKKKKKGKLEERRKRVLGHNKAKYTSNQEPQKIKRKKPNTKSGTTHRSQGFLDAIESKEPEDNGTKEDGHELFQGGDGLSENSPVSINCASMEVAKSYMDIFIKDNCGDDCKRTDLEYTIANPKDNKKLIKVIPVTKPDGATMEFFFDLSRQVGNLINIFKMFVDKDQDDNIDQISGYQVGDNVEVIDGPFSEFDGVIEEVDHENNLLKVDISIFGRNASVELNFPQVKKK